MLKSVSLKLDDSAHTAVDDSQFDFKKMIKSTLPFNRMHAILSALQPRDLPRPETDLRLTASDGISPDSEIIQSSYAGDYFHTIFRRVQRIVLHQLKTPTTAGIRGFIFQGPPGTGKTTMARALSRELGLEFVYVDSSTVARAKYGESEKQIVKAFEEARRRSSLILIDDAEAIFPSRDLMNREEFYLGQNNVLFHQLDTIGGRKIVVVLTTNKPEQLDPALRDRLYPIQFPELDVQTIVEIAKLKCSQRKIPSDEILRRIRSAPESVTSIRALEKMVTEEYIASIERRADYNDKARSDEARRLQPRKEESAMKARETPLSGEIW